MHVTSYEVHGAVRCVDRRGHQDHRRDVDRHQALQHQVRHQDHRDEHHRDRQDEDQNLDVRLDRQDRRDVRHQDQDGIHPDLRGGRHQDQDEHQGRRDGHQDQDGNRSDRDETNQEPCVDQEVAGCADQSKTRDLEEEEWGDQQVDVRQVACLVAFRWAAFQGATEHVQRGALGVSLEAD